MDGFASGFGGLLLGYGSRLALECNIGNFLSAWTAAGTNAITFTAALLAGTLAGLKVTERFFLLRAVPIRFSYLPPRKLQILAGALLIFASVAALFTLKPLVGLFWAAGIAFGALGTISGICFATCYRDLVARSYASGIMVRAIGLALLTFSTGVYLLQLLGLPFSLGTPQISQIQVALGGFIFGVGISLAGSCIFSSEWRAATGSIYAAIVLLSTVFLGMPLLAIHYGWWLKVIPPVLLPPFSLYSLNPHAAYALPLAFSTALIVYGVLVDSTAKQAFSQFISTKFTPPLRLKH
ncbi:MAG: YeeE/YedE thiosulfate transporter family protein [Candidatus Caldarchaeum sp.]